MIFEDKVCLVYITLHSSTIMPGPSRYHIVSVISVFIGLFYITRTLLGIIPQSQYIGDERYNKEIIGELVEHNLQKNLTRNESTEKYLSSCFETQDKAILRIRNYCKTRTKIWTEVNILSICLVSFKVNKC